MSLPAPTGNLKQPVIAGLRAGNIKQHTVILGLVPGISV
jgi:hypothetical protein